MMGDKMGDDLQDMITKKAEEATIKKQMVDIRGFKERKELKTEKKEE
jgi:hypothetical protein